MDKYRELINNPPKFKITGTPREVKFDLISCMCDNLYCWTLKKNEDGDFKLNTHGYAFSNFQLKCRADDLEWMADDGDWDQVIRMINEGVQKVSAVKFRA